MRTKTVLSTWAVLFCAVCLTCSVAADKATPEHVYSFYGESDKDALSYKVGEKMVFSIKLLDKDKQVGGIRLDWTREGEDGKKESGKAVSSATEPLIITTSIDRPGFVRIRVIARDKNGKTFVSPVYRYRGKDGLVCFDGGAGAEVEKLKSWPEPKDFDAFWARQKAKLAKVPMRADIVPIPTNNANVLCWDVKVDCVGKPVSGYLCKPKDAKPKSLPARISFHGAGVRSASKPIGAGATMIAMDINAHGLPNGEPAEFYENLNNTTLNRYGRLNVEQNRDPETCYWNGMVLRLIRALEFLKSQPEWDGKTLTVTGGSQGGFQSLVAAGLDSDVTNCDKLVPWFCDLSGKVEQGRLGGSAPAWIEGLGYYDAVNHAKRIKARVTIVSGAGDYSCAASSQMVLYNNINAPKRLEFYQGWTHGFRMKNAKMSLLTNEKEK